MVPNYPLLFFGEKLNYDPTEGVINVDGFVRVRSSRHVAQLVQVSLVQQLAIYISSCLSVMASLLQGRGATKDPPPLPIHTFSCLCKCFVSINTSYTYVLCTLCCHFIL